MVIFAWGFFYFIFLKIFTSFVYYESISLVASLIIAVSITLIEIPFGQNNMRQVNGYLAKYGTDSRFVFSLIRNYGIFFLIASIVSVLVAKGFSERFFESVLEGGYRDFLQIDWGAVLLFSFAIFLMTCLQLFLVIISMKLSVSEMRNR